MTSTTQLSPSNLTACNFQLGALTVSCDRKRQSWKVTTVKLEGECETGLVPCLTQSASRGPNWPCAPPRIRRRTAASSTGQGSSCRPRRRRNTERSRPQRRGRQTTLGDVRRTHQPRRAVGATATCPGPELVKMAKIGQRPTMLFVNERAQRFHPGDLARYHEAELRNGRPTACLFHPPTSPRSTRHDRSFRCLRRRSEPDSLTDGLLIPGESKRSKISRNELRTTTSALRA